MTALEALTQNNLLTALVVLVAVLELIALIGRAADTIKGWRRPAATIEQRLDEHDSKLTNDYRRINDLAAGNRAMCLGIKALLSHEINGNSVDKLRAAQTDIDNYLINR